MAAACLRLQLRREERKVTITAGKDKIKRRCGVSSQTVAGAPGDLFSRLIFTAKERHSVLPAAAACPMPKSLVAIASSYQSLS